MTGGKENTYLDMSVGVTSVRDEKVKRDLHSSDALGLCWGLGHLKIETTLRVERFENVKGEYVI